MRRRRSGGIPAAAVALVALALAAGAARAAASAPHPLLASAQAAPTTVVGTIEAPRQLDPHGWAAVLVVERTLRGALAPGARQTIAWEERATNRPPRLAEGERVLVALEPLPSASIWRARFPDGAALVIAAEGRALLAAPDAASVDALAALLALDDSARAGSPGAAALLAIAAEAAPPLAEAALSGLGARGDLDAELDDAARSTFARLVNDASRPVALREQALALAGERRLAALRPLIAPHATPGDPLELAAWSALASIDGGLAPETVATLLARSDAPALRALALRAGGDAPSDERLAALTREDPAGAVRAAAAEALLARRGPIALDVALPLLFDRDPAAARAVANAIGRLGEAAVPTLRTTFEERPYEEPAELTPVALALSQAGPAGVAALEAIAKSSEDPKRRRLAALALGRLGPPGH